MTTPSYSGNLPPADCPLGYTDEQLSTILGDRLGEFSQWMCGQTVARCDGLRYDYNTRQSVPTECVAKPHGMVTYGSDLRRFLARRRA